MSDTVTENCHCELSWWNCHSIKTDVVVNCPRACYKAFCSGELSKQRTNSHSELSKKRTNSQSNKQSWWTRKARCVMANIRVTKCQVNVNVIDTMYVMVDWHSRSQLSKRTVMVKWYGELSWRQSQHSDSHSDLSQCLYCLCAVCVSILTKGQCVSTTLCHTVTNYRYTSCQVWVVASQELFGTQQSGWTW